jgi:hypothetical protein
VVHRHGLAAATTLRSPGRMAPIDEHLRDERSPTPLRRWSPLAAAIVVLVALDAAVYAFVKRKGVAETGDEPHYLVVARAVSHFTVHPLQAYKVDLRTHQLFDWAAGTRPTNLVLQLYDGPHGAVSEHPVGLSVLLAPFVALGGAGPARLGLMALNSAGFVYFFHRASALSRLGLRARVVFALVLTGPAVWVAATQIYPDFLTGVLLACALVDIVALEQRLHLDIPGAAVSAACLAVLPWLHQQNLVPAVLALAAFLLLGWRARRQRPGTGAWPIAVAIAAVSVVSWLLLLGFNIATYGHALGLPQPFPSLNGAGATEILGLFFDRHQGLFVQLPTAVVGLVGMWVGRRAAPVALIATALGAASLVYLNGTFTQAPYGGLSLAGRFEWSSLVPLLVWCPFAIAAIDRVARRVWGLAAAAAALWVLQAAPIVTGHHQYYNQQLFPGLPWDPAGYPGWWGPFDRVLPALQPTGAQFGLPSYALISEVVLLLVATALIASATRPGRAGLLTTTGLSVAVGAGTLALVLAGPLPLPGRTLTFPGADVGSPLVASVSAVSVSLPLQGVEKGTYIVTIDYRVEGSTGSAIESFCEHGPATAGTPSSAASLLTGSHTASLELRCPKGTIWFGAAVLPATKVTIGDVRVKKISNG